jgi:hypothetical protein
MFRARAAELAAQVADYHAKRVADEAFLADRAAELAAKVADHHAKQAADEAVLADLKVRMDYLRFKFAVVADPYELQAALFAHKVALDAAKKSLNYFADRR